MSSCVILRRRSSWDVGLQGLCECLVLGHWVSIASCLLRGLCYPDGDLLFDRVMASRSRFRAWAGRPGKATNPLRAHYVLGMKPRVTALKSLFTSWNLKSAVFCFFPVANINVLCHNVRARRREQGVAVETVECWHVGPLDCCAGVGAGGTVHCRTLAGSTSLHGYYFPWGIPCKLCICVFVNAISLLMKIMCGLGRWVVLNAQLVRGETKTSLTNGQFSRGSVNGPLTRWSLT